MIQESLDELWRMRHPAVVMWGAEKLLSDIYGKEREAADEDDTRLVIGDFSEATLAEADAILAEAASKPPEVGLSALADKDALEADAKVKPQNPVPKPPATSKSASPSAPIPAPSSLAPLTPSASPPPAAPSPTKQVTTNRNLDRIVPYGGDSGDGGFPSPFGGGGFPTRRSVGGGGWF